MNIASFINTLTYIIISRFDNIENHVKYIMELNKEMLKLLIKTEKDM